MPALRALAQLLGLRQGVPNHADIDNATSRRIAVAMLDRLGRQVEQNVDLDPGRGLERAIMQHLAEALPMQDAFRQWSIDSRQIWTFSQYSHLSAIDAIVKSHPALRVELGRDYLIKPDVTVGVHLPDDGHPVLHAAISAKWTIRSDRVQNIRHEAVVMTRTRRGRLPHIVAVTAEPLPSRLASIARGTGEVDAVYHIALDELVAATESDGTDEQRAILEEIISQRRLFDFGDLAEVLVLT
jgi:hypothetical protein